MIDHFSPRIFSFLRKLKKNNSRKWFQAHKAEYESELKEPILGFIAALAPGLKRIAPSILADPRPVGGSLFRIYRDVRFSHDKSPYKTHAGAQFRHRAGKDVHAAGFYLHLEPGNVFAAGGLWRPEPEVLAKIREAIVRRPGEWRKSVSSKAFKARCYLDGERLKRTPRGFEDQPEPVVEILKWKDHCWVEDMSEKEACRPGFLKRVLDSFERGTPLMEFLSKAVGSEWE